MTTQTEYTAFRGGTDLMSPYLQVEAGRVIESLNFEALPKGGYKKIKGYELYDGGETPAALPGSGVVRGVHVYNGKLYAFRDDTVGKMYVESGAGWAAVTMPTVLYYDGAGLQFTDGQAINGQTSGATATIVRAVLGRGTLAGTTGEGVLTLTSVVGTFQNDENIRVGTTVHALANGTTSTYALPAGGFYRFRNHNFFGQAATKRMYGVNGVGDAFEFDGTNFVPIPQGPAGVYPSHITMFKEHLMLGYDGGSVVGSADGDPMDFTALNGAFEITTGDNLTEMETVKGSVIFLGGQETIHLVYGDDAANLVKKEFAIDRGVRANSMQLVGDNIVVLDALGVQNIQSTDTFGDYAPLPISYDVESALLGALTVTSSGISQHSQAKSQYRLFIGANAFFFTFNGVEMVGAMLVGYDHTVRCATTGLSTSGNELMFFGSDDGKVFKQESANFFDGEPIGTLIRLPFAYERSPTRRKRYDKAVIDMKVEGVDTTLAGFADYTLGQSTSTRFMDIVALAGSTSKWNQVLWNEFKWATASYSTPNVPIRGLGLNMGLVLAGVGTEDSVFTLFGVVTHYKMRKLLRANV